VVSRRRDSWLVSAQPTAVKQIPQISPTHTGLPHAVRLALCDLRSSPMYTIRMYIIGDCMFRFVDSRGTLPTHESKRFKRREVKDIKGGVIHHTASESYIENVAKYHVSPNHVCKDGCAGLLYTFFIDKSGTVYWANDLENITHSQGGHSTPIPKTQPNKNFLAIVCSGNYGSESNTGVPMAQLLALLTLWSHLTGETMHKYIPTSLYNVLGCSVNSLWGHHNFSPTKCPGNLLSALADNMTSLLPAKKFLSSVEDWQVALNGQGYGIHVDGIWGPISRAALILFQRDHGGLVVDGKRGPFSEGALLTAMGY